MGLFLHSKAKHNESNSNECKIRSKTFASKTLLETHTRVHTVEKLFVRSTFEPEHECKICGKKFHRLSDLSSHMKYHSQPTHQCKRCGKNFHSLICLKVHEKSHLR